MKKETKKLKDNKKEEKKNKKAAVKQEKAKEKINKNNDKTEIKSEKKSKKKKAKTIEGIFFANVKGYGFVRTEESKEDYFIPRDNTKGAFHGDTVRMEILSSTRGAHKEGLIKEIVKRELKTVVGVSGVKNGVNLALRQT